MKETRFFYVPEADTLQVLPAEEAAHAVRVLRLAPGDDIFLTDGKGNFYEAEVTLAANHHCGYRILQRMPPPAPWWGHIHLAMAPAKRRERADRVEKIVVSAMKQSRKPWKPVVNELISFEQFLKRPLKGRGYIAHCYEEIPRTELVDELKKTVPEGMDGVTLLIGPEGDFSIDEVKAAISAGYVPVSLGQSRLRTETACLVAVMMAHWARL